MKKKNAVGSELLLFLLILVLVAFMEFLSGGRWQRITTMLRFFTDTLSIGALLLFVGLGLVMSGVGKDFFRAFSVGKKTSLAELKNILEAVRTCQRFVLYGGLIEMFVNIEEVLFQGFSPDREAYTLVLPFAAAILPGFYIVVAECLLLPLAVRVQKAVNKEMDFDEEE